MSKLVIKTEHLSKTYIAGKWKKRAFTALADLNIEVKQGEIFAFLGPNGAGKSTTINLIMGFLHPTQGEIKLFNDQIDFKQARRRIGYLPENFAFYPFLSAAKLLDFFARLSAIPTALRTRRIEELLHKLGLWEVRNVKVGKYSRGMRQRVGLAQALLNEPELLILDEPTSGFDPLGRRMVQDLLLEAKQRGTSIFLSSHILSEVEDVCDRVVIVKQGKVLKQGKLKEIAPTASRYEITFSTLEPTLLSQLQAWGLEVTTLSEEYRAFTVQEALAQQAVDLIRRQGGILKGFNHRTASLEEAFLNLVS